MILTCYSDKFKKRKNSTKRPDISGTDIEVLLKDNTSLFEPTFILTYDGAFPYVYFKWSTFYYFLVDVISVSNGVWEVKCIVDVLATWKDDILNTQAFVIYSSNNYIDNIVDSRLPNRTNVTRALGSALKLANATENVSDCAYILQIAGTGGNSLGGTSQIFACSLTDAVIVNRNLMNADDSIKNELYLLFGGQLTNAIISLKAIPYIVTSVPHTIVNPSIGNFDLGISLPLLTTPNHITTRKLSFVKQYSDFRKISCCRYYVYLPLAGLHELDGLIVSNNDIYVTEVVDFIGGTISYYISTTTDYKNSCIYTTSAVYSCDMATTSYNANKVGSIYNMTVSALDKIIDSISNPNFKYYDYFSAPKELTGQGVNGGFGQLLVDNTICSFTEYTTTSDIPSNIPAVIGRPCFRNLPLKNCNGYVKTDNISVSTEAPAPYKDMINAYIDGGCFLE